MKKHLLRNISIALVLAVIFGTVFSNASVLRGDLNNDGKVNSSDALIILRIAVGKEDTPSGDEDPTTPQKNPEDFTADEIVSYYNTCLKNSYSQPNMKVSKTEKTAVSIDELKIDGKEASSTIQSVVNSLVSKNAVDNNSSMAFTDGKATDGTSADSFVLPANLSVDGAKSATISKTETGYRTVITLVEEKCDFVTSPAHNASCAKPLNINDIDLGGKATIANGSFVYTGTKLTADIDSQGRVTYVQVDMPLNVVDGTGTILIFPYKGKSMCINAHGAWTCKNTLTF